MPVRNTHRPGDYLMKSDYSGRVFYASEMRRTWEGYMVHHSEWEPKHPQLNVRALPREARLTTVRPRQAVSAAYGSLYLTTVGETNVPAPFGPATHIFEGNGIGDMQIEANFIVS